jgi:uncharacterized membrane protein
VTVVANVPLNDALGAGQVPWTDYLRRWTAWNTVRTVASLASGVLLTVVLAGGG